MNGKGRGSVVVRLAVGAAFLAMMCFVFVVAIFAGLGAQQAAEAACEVGPSAAGEPGLIADYINAASRFRLGADGDAYLAAINQVETGFGTDLNMSSAGAVGWMQFEPSTWREYQVNVSDPGKAADPDNPADAIFTAAHYLRALGAPGDWPAAIDGYNHAASYVAAVTRDAQPFMGASGLRTLADTIARYWSGHASARDAAASDGFASAGEQSPRCAPGGLNVDVTPVAGKTALIMPDGLARPPAQAPRAVWGMIAAGDRIHTYTYSWGGGHCLSAMDQQQVNLTGCPGDEEHGGPGFDCSGATSYVLWGGGQQSFLGDEPETSGAMMTEGDPGSGRWVTVYANAGHVFIDVAGAVMDTAWYAPVSPAGNGYGPRWQPASMIGAQEAGDGYGGFVARHPAGL